MNENIFRTIFQPVSFDFDISYNSKMVFSGSCFTENIGNKLRKLKFNVIVNPFGIVYNPFSVAQSLFFIMQKKQFAEKDLIFYNEYWHSFYHHGKFSNVNKKNALEYINNSISEAHDFLKKTNFLFITFGTSWVYEYKNDGNIVANCHKLPGSEFNKRCSDADEIVILYNDLIKEIQKFNKNIRIIFSISPVRHLKDGFTENFLSKAILRTSIETVKKSNTGIYYFPAYEILNDDLRDYRFYGKDLVHPNEFGVEYIFDFFKNSFFTKDTISVSEKTEKILQLREHRIFDRETEQTKNFINAALIKINNMKKEYPFINLEEEETYFNSLK